VFSTHRRTRSTLDLARHGPCSAHLTKPLDGTIKPREEQMERQRTTWRTIGLALTLTCAVGGHAMARERQQQAFSSPTVAGAGGRVRLTMQNASDGRLDLRVRGLAPDQTFDVLIGSVKVGTLSTTGGGQGAVRFRTRPRGHDLMLGFDPHGALLTIRDANGTDVLVTQLPAGTPTGSDTIICCVPDDRGDECEQRTADECTARGGTAAAATSCLPNPCENAPPVNNDKIICCVPDDRGAECEDRSAADCSARGGMAVTATSCDPNPCAATPPAEGDIQCCIPDDSGAECEDRTPTQCAAQGGTNMGPGTCTPNPCAASTPATGADDSGGGRHGGGGHHGGDDSGGDNHGGAVGGTYYGVPTSTAQ
jgi:hypothetical protein